MKINEIGTFAIYGHPVDCRILAIRECGTVDVERLSDGNCFRLTGLPVIRQPPKLKLLGAEECKFQGVVIT